jgi:hypothetical protein
MTKQEAQHRIQSHLDEIGFLIQEYPDPVCLVNAFAEEAQQEAQ